MSALGQKQTFAPQNVMSALPPKADIRSHIAVSTRGRAYIVQDAQLTRGHVSANKQSGAPVRAV
jgi:hypothetical protein